MNSLRILLFALLTAGAIQAQAPSESVALPPASGANAAASDERNLLVNANFENGTDGWELIAFHREGTMAIDTKELHNGKPTLRIDNVEADHSFVRQIVTGKPNTRYRLTGYIKTKNLEPVKPGERSGAVLMVGMTLDCTRPMENTSSWTKVTLDFTTTDKTEIRVGPSLGTYASSMTCTAWFSELVLVAVPNADADKSITDIKTQLEGTSWKASPDSNVRPGLYPTLTFKKNNVEPAGYRYQIDSHDFTVRIYFNHGDTQLLLLQDNGTRLGFTFQGKDYSYALASRSEIESADPAEAFLRSAPASAIRNKEESPEAAGILQPKMLRVTGTIDGSGRIAFTRYSVVYDHKHWSRPTDMTFDGEPWDLLRTPESWGKLGEQLDLSKAWIVKRSGRDVIALEHTADGFDLYLCDSPNGAAPYEAVIAIPRR